MEGGERERRGKGTHWREGKGKGDPWYLHFGFVFAQRAHQTGYAQASVNSGKPSGTRNYCCGEPCRWEGTFTHHHTPPHAHCHSQHTSRSWIISIPLLSIRKERLLTEREQLSLMRVQVSAFLYSKHPSLAQPHPHRSCSRAVYISPLHKLT